MGEHYDYWGGGAAAVPDAGDERGPFMHGEGCPDEPTGRLTDQCTCGQREAVNKLLVPDAGDDTLRTEVARIACEALDWQWLPERTETGHTLVPSPTEAIMPAIDALLPLIREHAAAAVKAERERLATAYDDIAVTYEQDIARGLAIAALIARKSTEAERG